MRIDLGLQQFKFRLAQAHLLGLHLLQQFIDLVDHGIHRIAEHPGLQSAGHIRSYRQIPFRHLICHLGQSSDRSCNTQRNIIG